jgi:predicted transcriptional regulator
VTLVGRLTERGFLRFERGRRRERDFYPLISRDEYLRMETEEFVRQYHKQSYTSLLNALQREQMTNEDLDELARWVDDARSNPRR